ncbi:MAG TPA: IS4 family transposase, partial [Microthrixaceae bacterium]|nr:IS4 family transposase [Microthrixaceae bacterium]
MIASGTLGVAAIGKGLAAVRGVEAKHATKQVDRLLSNLGIDMDLIQARWVGFQLREVEEAWVNLDWTDAHADDQTTLVASLQEDRGRSTPLMWMTVRKSELEDRKFGHVETLLKRLHAAVPSSVKRTFIVADREFGNRRMYGFLQEHGFDYVLRFRQDVNVTSWEGE